MKSNVLYYIDKTCVTYARYFRRLPNPSRDAVKGHIHTNIHDIVVNRSVVPIQFPGASVCLGWGDDSNRTSSIFENMTVSMDFKMKLGAFSAQSMDRVRQLTLCTLSLRILCLLGRRKENYEPL
jgi:hypothetical protein